MKTHNKPVIMMDFGGVYFSEGVGTASKKIAQKYNLDAEDICQILRSYHRRQERKRGGITRREFWKILSRDLKVPVTKMKDIENIWHSSYKPQKGMPELVKRLRKHYRVVSFSGNIPERVRFLDKKYNILKEFHQHHFSFDYGLTKYDGAKFFMAAVKRMHLKPWDCIVVDDKKGFLKDIRKTRAKTILFKNAKQLQSELRKNGVEI